MEQNRKKDGKEKLPNYSKGFAVIGFLDASVYDFISEFGLFFLTSLAGVRSSVAGSILSVANFITAFLSPIVGYASDHSKAKWGKRRTYILIGGLGCIIFMPFMMIPIQVTGAVKIGFYGFVVIAFFVAYTLFSPPYIAYGADISDGYDERSDLRTWVTVFNNIGTAAAYVLSSSAIAAFMALGMTEHISWFVAAMIICVISLVCLLVGIKMTKGHDSPVEDKERMNIWQFIKDMVISYLSLLKLKTMRIILLITFFAVTGYTIKTYGEMFLLTYVCDLSGAQVALYFLISCGVISILRPIPTNWILKWFGKKNAFIICVALYIVSAAYYAIAGMDGLADVLIYGVFCGFILDGYWQILPAMLYDITDVDMYFYKKEREGTIVSLQALIEGIGTSFGSLIAGAFIAFYKFNEDAAWEADELGTISQQTDHAVQGILYLNTWLPAIFFAIAALIVLIFPINKARHDKLRKALDEGVYAEDNKPEYDELKKLN